MSIYNVLMKKLIGLCGVARCGKDTFFNLAKQYIENKSNIVCTKVSFAECLRQEINETLIQNFNISAWTENTNEKEQIRDLLVAWSKTRRHQDCNYWVNKIKINEDSINIITDVRYKNEVDFIHKNNGIVIYIQRKITNNEHAVVQACNDEERVHTVPLQQLCDEIVTWGDLSTHYSECINLVSNVLDGLVYTHPPLSV